MSDEPLSPRNRCVRHPGVTVIGVAGLIMPCKLCEIEQGADERRRYA